MFGRVFVLGRSRMYYCRASCTTVVSCLPRSHAGRHTCLLGITGVYNVYLVHMHTYFEVYCCTFISSGRGPHERIPCRNIVPKWDVRTSSLLVTRKRGMFRVFSFATPTRFRGEMKPPPPPCRKRRRSAGFVARRMLSFTPL